MIQLFLSPSPSPFPSPAPAPYPSPSSAAAPDPKTIAIAIAITIGYPMRSPSGLAVALFPSRPAARRAAASLPSGTG
ncbi:GL19823 [Drosophila persimilis]|uniref:GL19823 n=1 Tax=Drosophila persimilis TaxID=7234 RepID=B4GYD3_DROPE|nr:GL19823 [Drosophila persimilis]